MATRPARTTLKIVALVVVAVVAMVLLTSVNQQHALGSP